MMIVVSTLVRYPLHRATGAFFRGKLQALLLSSCLHPAKDAVGGEIGAKHDDPPLLELSPSQ